ncbi:hypothetical protein QSI_4755 [Clostridioides difficile P28]|nr:hypothetical protein QSI_4755 [Clostridioides difficile P28]
MISSSAMELNNQLFQKQEKRSGSQRTVKKPLLSAVACSSFII